ncbi:hypothetical protein [Stenotrophomonas sp. LMG 10879]|uniref:hypothetical protein n=1 Tax=Stenotrophomonas sp. LMG 10879 TaxID=487706 RepID=UPI001FB00D4C|nr:hypothetical protein [Stenotrophomonas sp. LMG 10879]
MKCTLVVRTPLVKVHQGMMWVLFLALVVAARIHWPEPEEPEILAYRGVSDEAFWTLRRHALRFAEARARDVFEFTDVPNAASSFQVQCRGVPVLYVERQQFLLLIRLPLGAGRRAPAIFHLQATMEWPLQPLSYLEQFLAGVQEPTVQDRLLLLVTGGVPEDERCK